MAKNSPGFSDQYGVPGNGVFLLGTSELDVVRKLRALNGIFDWRPPEGRTGAGNGMSYPAPWGRFVVAKEVTAEVQRILLRVAASDICQDIRLEGEAITGYEYCVRLTLEPDPGAISDWMRSQKAPPTEMGHVGFRLAFSLLQRFGSEADQQYAIHGLDSRRFVEPFLAQHRARPSGVRYFMFAPDWGPVRVYHPYEDPRELMADYRALPENACLVPSEGIRVPLSSVGASSVLLPLQIDGEIPLEDRWTECWLTRYDWTSNQDQRGWLERGVQGSEWKVAARVDVAELLIGEMARALGDPAEMYSAATVDSMYCWRNLYRRCRTIPGAVIPPGRLQLPDALDAIGRPHPLLPGPTDNELAWCRERNLYKYGECMGKRHPHPHNSGAGSADSWGPVLAWREGGFEGSLRTFLCEPGPSVTCGPVTIVSQCVPEEPDFIYANWGSDSLPAIWRNGDVAGAIGGLWREWPPQPCSTLTGFTPFDDVNDGGARKRSRRRGCFPTAEVPRGCRACYRPQVSPTIESAHRRTARRPGPTG